MIISLRFKNFYSFSDATELSFAMGKKPAPTGYDINLPDRRLNKVIGVVGPNGSGKTNFIKPLAFLSWFACDSFLKLEPESDVVYQTHMLHSGADTEFELNFLIGNSEYRYLLILNNRRVKKEVLSVRTSSQFSYLFKREKTEDGFLFREKGFPFPATKARSLRDNASLLAAAHSYDIQEAKPVIDFFRRINSNVVYRGRAPFNASDLIRVAKNYHEDLELKERMVRAIQEFDLGLRGVDIEEQQATTPDGKTETVYVPVGLHRDANGKEFRLSFFDESNGTQSAFVVLEHVLKTLCRGGCAVIDEIDNDLHPHLIPRILDWFRFEHTNPNNAQLIFSCHTPEILNRLQKHQVYLCEKHNQHSEAWRLDEMEGLRADDNLYAKYMAGALGAVPEI
ncbi:abortive infection protein [Marinobacter santoriniensis NKSG1]|uniref:Abortive infection protein n=1 Tax=Marinobacter santoriniensis NKSG1 TaxID=1288826 RepID=M7CLR8_9GAMM|nr:ATP-binding protein [Marinobacter santoriniensis]EMP54581.1 abortive infection protein [Marinobacter santoriniensis NKSG1]